MPLFWDKDKGIVYIANTLPHSRASVLAGVILALTHSYSFLYIAATIFVLLGILVVIPIKAVRELLADRLSAASCDRSVGDLDKRQQRHRLFSFPRGDGAG